MKQIHLSYSKRGVAALALSVVLTLALLGQPAWSAAQGGSDESLKKGDDLYKAGKYQDAIAAYKETLGRDPNNDQAIGNTAFAYHHLGDEANALQWMKRRVEIPGQSPSKKAQTLTDITIICWQTAHFAIASRLASGSSPQDSAAAKLISEGIDSAQKAVAIAPKFVRAFNGLNLLYRASAAAESDAGKQKEWLGKADEALRQSILLFEAGKQQQADFLAIPTISVILGADKGAGVQLGQATKSPTPGVLKDSKGGALAVEVFVGLDGKIRQQRVIAGEGKPAEAALAAVKQWEFGPSTFEGHPVQVIKTISFSAK